MFPSLGGASWGQRPEAPPTGSNNDDFATEGEPPVAIVTSDLQTDANPPRPRAEPSRPVPTWQAFSGGAPRPPTGSPATPSHSRVQVLLNLSPSKHMPDAIRLNQADLDALDKKSHGQPSKQRPATTAAPASSSASLPPPGKRPRGRPKGWRPGMPSTKTGLSTASSARYIDKDGDRIMPPPSTATTTKDPTMPKRRGRPPRAVVTPRKVWETMAPPSYVPFACEWLGCQAELQNIQTLRRHVRVVHLAGGGAARRVCRWGRCAQRAAPAAVTFASPDELREHMVQWHLVPFVWHVGDGPRNERCLARPATKGGHEAGREGIPGYLLGAEGTQVTPSVREQELEDIMTWKQNRRRLRAILLQRDENAPLEEAKEQADGEEDDSP